MILRTITLAVLQLIAVHAIRAQFAITNQNRIGCEGVDQVADAMRLEDGSWLLLSRSFANQCDDKSSDSFGLNDYWFLKLNPDLSVAWENTFGGDDYEFARKIGLMDDGYIFCGYSSSDVSGNKTTPEKGIWDTWFIKTDFDGNELWQKVVGGDSVSYTIFNDLAPSADGGFVIASRFYSGIGGDILQPNHPDDEDVLLYKLEDNGELGWQRSLGGPGYEDEPVIIATGDGGYLVACLSYSDSGFEKSDDCRGGSDVWLVKLDDLGNIEWDKTYGGSLDDNVIHIAELPNGNYLVACDSESDVSGDKTIPNQGAMDSWFLVINPIGEILNQFGAPGSEVDLIHGLTLLDDDRFITAGNSRSEQGNQAYNESSDIRFIEYTLDGTINWIYRLDQVYNQLGRVIIPVQSGFFAACHMIGIQDQYCSETGIDDPYESDLWVFEFNTPVSNQEFTAPPLRLFPNPTVGEVTLSGLFDPKEIYEVMDISGKFVLHGKIGEGRIDLSDLDSGLYLIKIGNFVYRLEKL